MESFLSFGHQALGFIALLTVLVFVHEWGHYIIARINGVRVEVFSIGFGPEIWGFDDKNGTRWKFSWIPLGGYVKFFGDASEASTPGSNLTAMTEAEKKVSFHHKKLSQRAAIVFAGPAVNFLFAILILAGMFYTYGRVIIAPVVGEVLENSAASEAGMLPGDRIISIDGQKITGFRQIKEHLYFKVQDDVAIDVNRDGTLMTLNFTLKMIEEKDMLGQTNNVRQIGISASRDNYEIIKYGPIESFGQSIIQTKNLTERNLQGLWQIIVGDRSAKELGGPITIARVAGKAAEAGFVEWINIAALISISLGMINLFPIPMLDGGHLLFYAIEAIRGRKLSENAQEYGFRIGLALVLSLMIFATVVDIEKIL
jgi:regulator of sigma E protease